MKILVRAISLRYDIRTWTGHGPGGYASRAGISIEQQTADDCSRITPKHQSAETGRLIRQVGEHAVPQVNDSHIEKHSRSSQRGCDNDWFAPKNSAENSNKPSNSESDSGVHQQLCSCCSAEKGNIPESKQNGGTKPDGKPDDQRDKDRSVSLH